MEPKNTGPNKNELPKGQGPSVMPVIIIGFIITFVINLLINSMASNTQTQIEYSQFIRLVESGSVERVQIEDEQILISLKKDADKETIYTILGVQSAMEGMDDRTREQNERAIDSSLFYTGKVSDNALADRLLEYDVAFSKLVVTSNPILDFISSWVFPILIVYGLYFFFFRSIMKRMGGDGGGLGGMMSVGKSKAKLYDVEKNTGVSFADVAGQNEAKESLNEIVDFLHNPAKYQKIGAKQPKGALLVGPPGTGKTLLAKAVAGEASVPFFSLSGSEFVEMFVGVGASRVRDLFAQAAKNAPCIIFIDEIDAIGKSRDNQIGGNDEREQTLNQLLAEMDGFDTSKGIVILAATNRPEILDKALLRPGRFDRRIIVEKPDLPGREAILEVHAAKVLMDGKVNLRDIALATSGATGADLANMINEGALRAVKMDRETVTQEDLMEAVETVIAGKEKKDRVMNPKEKRMVAYHEVGHALASALQKGSVTVQKITIVPRTMGSLGYTMNTPDEERYLLTKRELLTQITMMLGGRAAEEIVFDEMTTGAADDIERATSLARSMVTQYGMSGEFGAMGLESAHNQYLDGRNIPTCSEATGAAIDTEVRKIMSECHDKALALIRENRDSLTRVAEHLIEKETITGAEFMELLEKPLLPGAVDGAKE